MAGRKGGFGMRGVFARKIMTRKQTGFTIAEALVALSISSLAMAALGLAFVSSLKAGRAAGHHFEKYRDLRPFFTVLQRELRSMVPYERFPFRGNDKELEFPGREVTGQRRILRKIRYGIRDHHPFREESPLKEPFKNQATVEKVFLLKAKSLRFEYPYRDASGRVRYLPFWLEEPYQGLPAAVRVTVEAGDGEGAFRFVKLIDIPQGNMGVLPHGSE